MAIKVIITDFLPASVNSDSIYFEAGFIDTSTNLCIENYVDVLQFGIHINNFTSNEFISAIETKILNRASALSLSIVTSDISYSTIGAFKKSDITTIIQSKVVTDGVSHSFVTTAAAANGFQVSSTRDALVSYSVTAVSAVQIGLVANVSGYIVLEVASTNSTTAADWKEKGRVGIGQNVGLALALSSTQTATAPLMALVPSGYYARIRTVNTNGTPTYTYVTGTEVLM